MKLHSFVLLLIFSIPAIAQAAHQNTLDCTPATTGGTATSFNFKMSLTAGGPYTTIGSPATCHFVDSQNMVEGQKRFYVVTAVNATGESGSSNEVSAITPFSKPDPATLKQPVSQ